MPDNKAYSIELSQEELLLILLRMRLPLLPGVDRRMLDLPKEDLKGLMDSAEMMLLSRDFLRRMSDDNLQLAPILTAIIVTCTKPEKTILASRTRPSGQSETVMVHMLVESIVVHMVSATGKHKFVLYTEQTPVIEALLTHVEAKNFTNPDVSPVEIPEEVYVQANKLAQSNDPGQLYTLLSRHMPAETATRFHQSLNLLSGSVTLARLIHGEKPEEAQQDGFNLIQGNEKQWLLRSTGAGAEKKVTLEGAALKDVRRELKKLFK